MLLKKKEILKIKKKKSKIEERLLKKENAYIYKYIYILSELFLCGEEKNRIAGEAYKKGRRIFKKIKTKKIV